MRGNVEKLTHSQIAAKRRRVEELNQVHRLPLVVVADNIRSLYNVGSIFRSSDGILIEKLVLTGFTPKPPRTEIEKTALGSTESVPWEYVQSPLEAVRGWKERGYTIACLELTDTSIPYNEFPATRFPLCLVIGNEINGVSKDVVAIADIALEIPMVGIKQSLNVAVAYGIAAFELAKIFHTQNARVK